MKTFSNGCVPKDECGNNINIISDRNTGSPTETVHMLDIYLARKQTLFTALPNISSNIEALF